MKINWKGLNYDYYIYFANGSCITFVPFFDSRLQPYNIHEMEESKRAKLLIAVMEANRNMDFGAVTIHPLKKELVLKCTFRLNMENRE